MSLGLRGRLIILVILGAAPTLAIEIYTGLEQRRQALDDIRNDVLTSTRNAAETSYRLVGETKQLLVLLSRQPEVDPHNTSCPNFLVRFFSPQGPYSNIGVADVNGNLLCSAMPLRDRVNIADRSYFKRTLEIKDFAAGDYQIGRVSGVPTLNFAYPVYNSEKKEIGVIFAALSLKWLNVLFTDSKLPTGSVLIVIDSDLTVLARYPDYDKWVGKQVGDTSLAQELYRIGNMQEGAFEVPGLDGVPRWYGVSSLFAGTSSKHIRVLIGIPTEVAYAKVEKIVKRNLTVLSALFFLLLAFAWWGSKVYITKQWNNLVDAARRLADGQMSTRIPVVKKQNEFSLIANTFNIMAAAIEQRTLEVENNLVRIARLNRVHTVLSSINSAIIRHRDKKELEKEACLIAVEKGNFILAWIGDIDWQNQIIRPCIYAGRGTEYIADKIFSFSDPNILNKDPVLMAVRENRHYSANFIHDDSGFHAFGIGSGIALPLRIENQFREIFVFYAKEKDFFNEEEIKLLLEVADDTAYGLEYIEKEQRLRHLAYYDPLTDLPNRTLFEDRIEQALQYAKQQRRCVGVAVLDIKQFRHVNQSYGHHAGDLILKKISEFLASTVGPGNTISRVGSDEFGIVMVDLDAPERVTSMLTPIIESFPRTILLPEVSEEIYLHPRAGAAVFPLDGDQPNILIRHASLALHASKTNDTTLVFYSEDINRKFQEHRKIEHGLRRAIEKKEFTILYQPVVDVQTRMMIGVESLLRWNSPELGIVNPGKFIPIAEESGLIFSLGEWIFEQVCAQAAHWNKILIPNIYITINVSVKQLQASGFAENLIKTILKSESMPLKVVLALEVTESELMENVTSVLNTLESLRKLGIAIYIDDFGTGYSSLSYLQKLPIDVLKIDTSFIRGITRSKAAAALVKSMISMSHDLNMKVVAEGVESEEEFFKLKEFGCDYIQGYLFSQPISSHEVEKIFSIQL